MKIVSFSVQKYRSITSAQKLPLGRVTTLIGPNNEGKSNILRALVVGMRLLAAHGNVRYGEQRRRLPRSRGDFTENYFWQRDFPKSLHDTQPNGRTIFDFEFELDDAERAEFYTEVKSKLNASLPIRLMIDRDRNVEIKVRKQGPGGGILTDKAGKIAKFVGSRIRFQYVPSVRTAEEARRVVDEMVSEALSEIEDSDDFQAAIAAIEKLQKPVLSELSLTIKNLLKEFLPEVQDARVEISSEARYMALRANSAIIVDDGTPTELGLKATESRACLRSLSSAGSRAKRSNGIQSLSWRSRNRKLISTPRRYTG